ncbi:hypothetical protein VSAK1_26290 [Vibrio mediterranei AK1]|uniref:GIY-YIG nuclease family protein n=1 Tax=Vibrio mediterranei TaxID=689 RepID=UPI0001541214|nr:GIY-YIG nuclease family protein [Vibrio mediterranei]EDL53752.1 hypothetical protein VSAK1_26290 [Vibrio mediterranei AK1]
MDRMVGLTTNHYFEKGEGGIYCIHYQNQMDLDFNDVDSVCYVGSTRNYKRRFNQHQRGLKNGHGNKLLNKVGKAMKRNEQSAEFTKFLSLPRNGFPPQHYDRVIQAVEHWLIASFKSLHGIESEMFTEGDYVTHRVANSSLPFKETAENGHNLSILLSSYRNTLEDGITKSILGSCIAFWQEFEWGDW